MKTTAEGLQLIELSGGPQDGRFLEVHRGVREISLPTYTVIDEGQADARGYRTYRRTRRKARSGRILFDLVPHG